ncbi:MAG TPA: hypothetical protein VHS99_01325 [Chloroflexota bacterium]|nr:hypothetical protein [Chloroflexota bacterium]
MHAWHVAWPPNVGLMAELVVLAVVAQRFPLVLPPSTRSTSPSGSPSPACSASTCRE